jgi:hypothetical protein
MSNFDQFQGPLKMICDTSTTTTRAHVCNGAGRSSTRDRRRRNGSSSGSNTSNGSSDSSSSPKGRIASQRVWERVLKKARGEDSVINSRESGNSGARSTGSGDSRRRSLHQWKGSHTRSPSDTLSLAPLRTVLDSSISWNPPPGTQLTALTSVY